MAKMRNNWLIKASDPYMKDGKCIVDITPRRWVSAFLSLLKKLNKARGAI